MSVISVLAVTDKKYIFTDKHGNGELVDTSPLKNTADMFYLSSGDLIEIWCPFLKLNYWKFGERVEYQKFIPKLEESLLILLWETSGDAIKLTLIEPRNPVDKFTGSGAFNAEIG